ncbi:MAG: Peptidase protein [Parachlamydiales bacterium]|nr:Peptidase protein [Parachlamydiales bacterium]
MEIQNESIFVSALRGFCRSLFILLGVFAAIAIASFAFFAFSTPYQAEEKTTLTILPNLEGKRDLAPLNSPAILRIDIHGIIGVPEHMDSDVVQSILLDSREGILQHDRIKGILLHFDTPGGTVIDSDNIYRMLLKYKQKYSVPVFGYVDGLCASGGMYIASAADRVYCGHSSVVGSVGIVMGPFFNIYDAITKIGVQEKTLTVGLDKDEMNPFRPWKPDEDAVLKKIMTHFYQQFVDVVTTGRPQISRHNLVEEYGAKIFDGPTAMELGYVDVADSDYETALTALMKEAKIDIEKPYQIVTLQPKRNIWTDITQGRSLFNGKIEHSLKIGSENSYTIKDRFAYLYQP